MHGQNAIPYITSYYERKWGFCLTQKQRDDLIEGQYEVIIDSKIFKGQLNYGDGLIQNGTNISVNVDNLTIEILNNILKIKDSGITSNKIEDDAVKELVNAAKKIDPALA